MSNSPFFGLRFRLSLLIAVVVVPAMLLNVFSSFQQRRTAAQEAERNALRLAHAISEEQEQSIRHVHELLTALSLVPVIRAAEPGECPAMLADNLQRFPQFTSMSVAGRDGTLRCRGLRTGGNRRVDGLAIESAWRRALETGDFAVGTYTLGTVTGKPVVPFALPLTAPDGRVDAVLTTTLDLLLLGRYADAADLPAGSSLNVVDGSGAVLARYPDPTAWTDARFPDGSPLRGLLTGTGGGVVEASGLDGVARLYAVSALPAPETQPVFVAVGIPYTSAYAAANRALLWNLLLLTLLGLAAAGAGWRVGTRSILEPVRSLVDDTRRLARGDLGTRAAVAERGGEFAALGVAFNEMAESLERGTAEAAASVAALRRSEERYRTLVLASAAIVWETPPTGEFRNPQPSWSEFTGQADEELKGWGWLDAVHPDDRNRIAQAWSRSAEEGALYQAEQRLRRRDGEYRHMLIRAVPILGPDGQVREWIGIHTDVTERKQAEQERAALLVREQEARAEAEQANRAKSDFLAVVSHELRTPLTSIISYAELMEFGVEGTLSDRHREYVDRINVSAWHLKELVDQILEFTRLEAGRVALQIQPTDLAGVVCEAVSAVEPLCVAKSLTLDARLPGSGVVVDTDATKVRQILLNLLSNAIKFSDSGDVAVGIVQEGDRVAIYVRDSGPGIPAEHLSHIWQRFWQSENPLTRKAGGTGLGLAIVRRLSELLEAEVRVESTVGEGSTFVLTLPRSKPKLPIPMQMCADGAVGVQRAG